MAVPVVVAGLPGDATISTLPRRRCPRFAFPRKLLRFALLLLLVVGSALLGFFVAGGGPAAGSHESASRGNWDRLAGLLSSEPLKEFERLFLDDGEIKAGKSQTVLRLRAHRRLHALLSADPPEPPKPSGKPTDEYYKLLTRLHVARYVANHNGRLPPPGFAEFVRWAADRGCEVDDYSLIDEDLEPYRKFYAGRPDVLKKAAAGIIDRYPQIYGIKIRSGKTVMDYVSEYEVEMRARRALRRKVQQNRLKQAAKNKTAAGTANRPENWEKLKGKLSREAAVFSGKSAGTKPANPKQKSKPKAKSRLRRRLDPMLGANADFLDLDDPAFALPPAPPVSTPGPGIVDPTAEPGEAPILDWMKEVYPPLIDPFAYALPDMDVPFNFYDEPRMFVRLSDFLEGGPMTDREAKLVDTLKDRQSDEIFRDLVSGLEPSWFDWRDEAKKMGCEEGVDSHGFFLGPTTLQFVDLTKRQVPMLPVNSTEFWVVYTENRDKPKIPFPSYPEDTKERVLLPIFGGAKPRQCFADITLPSYAALTYGSYPWGWNSLPTWESKSDKVYWRGTTTGGWLAGGRDWRVFHRNKFIKEWSGRKIDLPPIGKRPGGKVDMDVMLTGIKQCDETPGSARDDPAVVDILGDPTTWEQGFEPSVCDLAHEYYRGMVVKEYRRGVENLTVPEVEYWNRWVAIT